MKAVKISRTLFILTALLAFCRPICIYGETITFSADSMTGNASDTNTKTVLRGNAHIVTETLELTADKIELSGEDFRFIKAEGNIRGKNTESGLDFTCQKLTYDRTTKVATLEESVSLDDTENGVNARAERIEYDDKSHVAVMQIAITLTQKDNTCTASYALYEKDSQFLTLQGNPQVVQGTDTFRAQQITLNLDTQEITLDGRVRGSVTVTQKKEGTE